MGRLLLFVTTAFCCLVVDRRPAAGALAVVLACCFLCIPDIFNIPPCSHSHTTGGRARLLPALEQWPSRPLGHALPGSTKMSGSLRRRCFCRQLRAAKARV